MKQIAEAYRKHATPRSSTSYDPEGMPSNQYLAEQLQVRLTQTYNSKACKTLDWMATQLGKTQQKQMFIWSVFIKERDWAYTMQTNPLSAERGGASTYHVENRNYGDLFDVMVFVCPADESCLPHLGTFARVQAAIIKESLNPWGFIDLFVSSWMEATARLDQAGATVQRRPRAMYVGVVDKNMGVSVPTGHLFLQQRVPITTLNSTTTPRSEVVLTVILLPEREE